MRIFCTIITVCSAALALSACAVVQPDDGPIDRSIDALEPDDARAEQITLDADLDPAALLAVEQVESGDRPVDYEFAYVEGDDPCSATGVSDNIRCSGILSESLIGLSPPRRQRVDSTLSDLQTILPNIVDPTTFDADRTVDKIGRSDFRLQTQGDLAVGADFLAPPPLPEPEPEEPEAPALDGVLPGTITGK